MDRIEDHIRRLTEKPEVVISRLRVVQRIGGIILIILSIKTGRYKIDLLLNGERTIGTVVDYKQADWSIGDSANPTASRKVFMPIVEFRSEGRAIQFQDGVGSRVAGGLMQEVPVVFLTDAPEKAMIDRPILNWIPWGPMLLVGIVLLSNGFRRRRKKS